MPRYVIVHGSIHKGGHQPTGNVVELSEKEAKEIDPEGTCLLLESKHIAASAGEKAKAEAIKRVEAEQAAEAEKLSAAEEKKKADAEKQKIKSK